MEIYFLKTDKENLLIAIEGGYAKILNNPEDVNLYTDNAVDLLKEKYKSLDDSGDLDDFSDLGGLEVELHHNLYNSLAISGKLIFSGCGHPEVFSVQLEYDNYSDETFCGTEEECRAYIKNKGYKLGEDCRIALLSIENFFSDMTLYIIEE